MIELVISGGQTGADQAGWRAAWRCGIPTGGWMPKGFLTEDGHWPEFARWYGAQEHTSSKYPPRTEVNANWADVTIWLGTGDSAGFRCTEKAAEKHNKPFLVANGKSPRDFAGEIAVRDYRIINVAGNRESSSPGIGRKVEHYLAKVFDLIQKRS